MLQIVFCLETVSQDMLYCLVNMHWVKWPCILFSNVKLSNHRVSICLQEDQQSNGEERVREVQLRTQDMPKQLQLAVMNGEVKFTPKPPKNSAVSFSDAEQAQVSVQRFHINCILPTWRKPGNLS